MRNGILCCSESGGLTLDLYVSSPCAMGIISKSVAHACSGGARGFFKPNDQEYGKAAGFVKFYRDQEKPGRYVSEFKDPARVSCKHAHRAAQSRKAWYAGTPTDLQEMHKRETCRPCLRGTHCHFGCCPPALASLGQVLLWPGVSAPEAQRAGQQPALCTAFFSAFLGLGSDTRGLSQPVVVGCTSHRTKP